MHWSYRLFYPIAMLLAATPPLLSSRLARPAPPPAVAMERAGLTLGAGGGHHIIVTSLRSGGPADRSGIAVGDELSMIGGQTVTSVAMARRLINAPDACGARVDLHRGAASHVARLQQCRKSGPPGQDATAG